MELVKLLPVQNSFDIFFPYSGPALMDSKIPLGLGLWALELLRVSLVLMNRLNKTESAIVGSLYFQIICVLVN